MTFSINGVDDILKNLESKLGENRATRVVNKSLRKYGETLKKDVEEATAAYMDTGETHETVVVSNVKKGPPKQIQVGWGQGSRWRLVHLSEFGYTRFGRYIQTRGKGKLQAVADKTESTALKELRSDLEELAR